MLAVCNSTVFTFSHCVVDDVIVNVQALRPKDSDGWREAVVESTTLNVRVFSWNLSTQKKNNIHFTFYKFNRYFLLSSKLQEVWPAPSGHAECYRMIWSS